MSTRAERFEGELVCLRLEVNKLASKAQDYVAMWKEERETNDKLMAAGDAVVAMGEGLGAQLEGFNKRAGMGWRRAAERWEKAKARRVRHR